ncbi:MAG: glycosyltransferase family 4 protein [Kiritimatiellaeota bacterium]|nr:glycosyltransferase family 4 protein [Kiritimatiellota bacterium]
MCENCLRDQALIAQLRQQGHELVVIPIYLPMPGTLGSAGTPFYGAVRVYLEHRFPFFRRAPQWLKRWLDSPRVLRMAGKLSGTSSSRNLGSLTLSVLCGEQGGQAKELETLCEWLREFSEKPDIIHLSNALLIGMARRLKAVLNVPVVCSLQDEDTWIDAMPEPTASRIWAEIRARVEDVTGFLTVSQHAADRFASYLAIPPLLVRVVQPGLDVSRYARIAGDGPPLPSSAWNVLLDPGDVESLGFILQAFTRVRQDPSCETVYLHCSGVFRDKSRSDKSALRVINASLDERGLRHGVRFSPLMTDAAERLAFIQSSTLFTVLHRNAVAFDLSVLEAMACGIPAVLPDLGANPEIFARAEGGVLFAPNQADALAETVVNLFKDPSQRAALGHRGQQGVAQHFSIGRMALETLAAYETSCLQESLRLGDGAFGEKKQSRV